MTETAANAPLAPDDLLLADGLLLRRARPGDQDALAKLQASVHAGPNGEPSIAIDSWTRDLFDSAHPAVHLDDVTVVEDLASGALASSLHLVRQVWSYAGVPVGVGRLELVATHPDYRRRGLISRQMRVLHDRSTARGDLLQAITDLMFFHGEFGYHAALTQRAGRGGRVRDLPPIPDGGEPVRLRVATVRDVPALLAIDRHARQRSLLSCHRDADLWNYELTGRRTDSMVRDEILLVERAGSPVGYALLGYGGVPSFPIPDWLPGSPCPEHVISVSGLEAGPEISWWEFAPSVLRQLTTAADHDGFLLWLGREHPAYSVLPRILTRRPPPIGWFLRIPDLVAFLNVVTPVLQRRLAESAASGFTGQLRLHFYHFGLLLEFAGGRLVRIARWPDHSRRGADAAMPEQMFLQLLLGHADLAELAPAFPDHRIQTRLGEVLLPVLFPRQESHIWPVI